MPTELIENAALSQAAYAELLYGLLIDQKSQLVNSNINFSDAQFSFLAALYPAVVNQFSDTNTGFSATIFLDSTNSTGNLTIAFRGDVFM